MRFGRSEHWLSKISTSITALAGLFFLLYGAVNFRSIIQPGVEKSDYAVYAVQVIHAKGFNEYLGPYSRFGFNHPGPVSWYYLALMEPLLFFVKSDYGKHQLAQLFLNAFLLILSLNQLTRIVEQKITVFIFFAILLLCLLPYGKRVFYDLWPPTFLIFAMLCFTLSCVNVATGRVEDFWILAISGVFLLENNISTMVVLFPFTVMTFLLFIRTRSENTYQPNVPLRGSNIFYKYKKTLVFTVLFVTAAVFPPIYEQVTSDSGNLTKILRFLLNNQAGEHTFVEAIHYVSDYIKSPLPVSPAVNGPLLALALIGCTIWSAVSANRTWRYLVIYVCAAISLSIAAATRIPGPLHAYILRYDAAIISLLYFGALMPLFIRLRGPSKLTRVLGIIVAIVALVAAVFLYAIPYNGPDNEVIGIIQGINPEVGPEYEILLAAGHHDRWELAAGVFLQMKREGFQVCVPESLRLFGKRYVCKDETQTQRVVFYKSKYYRRQIREKVFSEGRSTVESGALLPLDIPLEIRFDSPEDYFYNWKPAGKRSRVSLHRQTAIELQLASYDELSQYKLKVEGTIAKKSQLTVSLNGVALSTYPTSRSTRKVNYFLCPGYLFQKGKNIVKLQNLTSFRSLSLDIAGLSM